MEKINKLVYNIIDIIEKSELSKNIEIEKQNIRNNKELTKLIKLYNVNKDEKQRIKISNNSLVIKYRSFENDLFLISLYINSKLKKLKSNKCNKY